MSTSKQRETCIGATREERNKQGTFLIEEVRDARWTDNLSATEMMKGGDAQGQRLLEAPRAEVNRELIVEITANG